MVFPLIIPAAIFALWAIPKISDSYDGVKKRSNTKKRSKK
jgi:hypothetical protein|tara:strand:+ start:367 stop:486 length:120 start_codon:yes stop_codon:yes gene_type:complete